MREQGTRPKRGRERVKRAPLTHRTRRITQRRRVPKERRRTPVMRRASRIMLKHMRTAGRHLMKRRQRMRRRPTRMPARAQPMEAAMRKRTLRPGIPPLQKRTRDKSTTRRTHPRLERIPSRSRVHRTEAARVRGPLAAAATGMRLQPTAGRRTASPSKAR